MYYGLVISSAPSTAGGLQDLVTVQTPGPLLTPIICFINKHFIPDLQIQYAYILIFQHISRL